MFNLNMALKPVQTLVYYLNLSTWPFTFRANCEYDFKMNFFDDDCYWVIK